VGGVAERRLTAAHTSRHLESSGGSVTPVHQG
jgi:hypothetical protein